MKYEKKIMRKSLYITIMTILTILLVSQYTTCFSENGITKECITIDGYTIMEFQSATFETQRDSFAEVLREKTFSMTQVSTNWTIETTLPGSYVNGGELMMAAYANNSIYIMGGVANDVSNNPEVWKYDLINKNWTQLSNMLLGASGMGITHYEGKIYTGSIFGSYKLQIYDIETNTWTYGEDMPISLYDYGMIAVNGTIYLPAGGNAVTYEAGDTLLIYDILNNSWSYGTPIPAPREGVYGLTEINEKIYIAGGADYNLTDSVLDSMYIYNIQNENWTQGTSMPEGLAYHGMTGIDRFAIVVGGWDYNWTMIDYAFLYDTTNDSWFNVQNLPERLAEPAIVSNGTSIFFIGGLHEDYVNRSNIIYELDLSYLMESVEEIKAFDIESPVNEVYTDSNVSINITVNDIELVNVTYSLNNGTQVEYTEPVTLEVSDGAHTLDVYSLSNTNMTEHQSVDFVVDTVFPYITDLDIESNLIIVNNPFILNVSSTNGSNPFINITSENQNYSFQLNQGYNELSLDNNEIGFLSYELYAIDNFSRVSEVVYGNFIVANLTNLTLNIEDVNTNTKSYFVEVTYGNSVLHNSSYLGSNIITIPATILNISLSQSDRQIELILQNHDNANFSDSTYDIMMDYDITEDLRKDALYMVRVPNNMDSAIVRFNFSLLGKSDDQLANIIFEECLNYNISILECNENFTDVSTDEIISQIYTKELSSGTYALQIIQEPFCGDFICDNAEDCSSCSSDCGICPAQQSSSSSSSSSGGGGGGSSLSLPSSLNPSDINTASCDSIWICDEWSSCSDGLQTRECTQESVDCDDSVKPVESRSCAQNNRIERPAQLFDIRFEVIGSDFDINSRIQTITYFESFGSVPTPVNLEYKILNANEEIVYSEQDSLVVEVENVLIKYFEIEDMQPGDYTIILTSSYSDDIVDEFRQSFTVKEQNNDANNSNNFSIVNIIILIVSFMAATAAFYLFVKSKKNLDIVKNSMDRKGEVSRNMMILIIMLISVILTSGFIFQYYENKIVNTEEEFLSNHLDDVAELKGNSLNSYFEREKKDIEFIAGLIRIKEYLYNPQNEGTISRALDALSEFGSENRSITILNSKAIVALNLRNEGIGLDYSDFEYFSIDNPKTNFSRYYDPYTHNDYYAVISPVFGNNTEVIGYIGYDINLKEIGEQISLVSNDKISEVYMIDQTSVIISAYAKGKEKYDLTLFAQEVKTKQAKDCLSHMIERDSHMDRAETYVNHRGYNVLGAHAHIPIVESCIFVEYYN